MLVLTCLQVGFEVCSLFPSGVRASVLILLTTGELSAQEQLPSKSKGSLSAVSIRPESLTMHFPQCLITSGTSSASGPLSASY